ncbi:MAG: hypothetical protein D6715_04570 [Calditrichaeota bacterium]|nr:MAG: hypothetical protein D6715_04570 [Calditrichota bacterium]
MWEMKITAARQSFVLSLLLLFSLVLGGPGRMNGQEPSDETEVLVTGVGAILNGDEAKAEDDALANALRNALQQVIGTMVESEVLVQNYQVLEDNIYTRTGGFVKTYQVVGRSKPSPQLLQLTIRAVVKTADLRNSLEAIGLLMERKGKPRLLVLVDEHNMHHHYWYYDVDLNTTATVLMSELAARGFPLVDAQVVKQALSREAATALLEGDNRSAEQIARSSGAEVLVIGKAVSKISSGGARVVQQAGLVSCQAMVNLRAVRADDGRVIATAAQQAVAAHIDELAGGTQALKKAASAAAGELMDQILKAWQQDVYSGATMQLRLLEVPSFNDLVRFKNQLKSLVRGIQGVRQREFAGGTALLELEGPTDAARVAEELGLKDFTPYQVEIVSVSQNTIIARLLTKP